MKEHRDFTLKRRDRHLTSENLMRILDQTEGGDRAKEAYKRLTEKELQEGENK